MMLELPVTSGTQKPSALASAFWIMMDTAVGQAEPTLRLYRNRGDGTFEDVTQRAGLALPLYGMGMAAADYDNDGDTDLVVTGYGRTLFFINNGDGTFTEAAQRVGLQQGKWGSGAA